MSRQTQPTKWHVPDGWVLTWYPPFRFPYAIDEHAKIFVYNEIEPFTPADLPDGSTGYNPNVTEARLSDFDGEHPGVYALNLIGDHPGFDPESPVHADAIQRFGKAVSA